MTQVDVGEVLDQVYAAVLRQDLWPAALQNYADALGSVGTLILPTASGAPPLAASESLGPAIADYAAHWAPHDTRLAVARTLKAGDFGVDAKHFSKQDVARDPFFQEFLTRWGLGDCFYYVIDVGGRPFVVATQRSIARSDYDASEMARGRLIAPHIARAAALSDALSHAGYLQRSLETILDHAGLGIILLDGSARCLHANDYIRSRLGDGLEVGADGQVRATDFEARRTLYRLLACIGHEPSAIPAGAVLLPRQGSRQPLHVEMVPLSVSVETGGVFAWAQAVAALIVRDATMGSQCHPRLRALGLTDRESQVASLVGEGLSPREIADKLAISEGTARVHLKTIFGKLGVSRQSALAILVTRLSTFDRASV